MAQSFSSSSNEFVNENRVACQCNLPAKVVKAWTDENTGRRFYKCRGQGRECKFFQWFDVEKPHGWQHIALLEAREVMREQRVEIQRLKNLVVVKRETDPMAEANKAENCEETTVFKTKILVLKREVSVMRNVLVFSWVGFTVVIGVTIALLR